MVQGPTWYTSGGQLRREEGQNNLTVSIDDGY